MIDLQRFRTAVAAHLGEPLTPEVAAAIELACRDTPSPIDLQQFDPVRAGAAVIHVERFAEIVDELHALHQAHWLETERHRHQLPLAPNYDAMAARERRGHLLQVTARVAGELVGHVRMYLGLSLHSQTLWAEEDTLYVAPAHRGALLGLRLLRYTEDALRRLGVREINANSKLVNNADVLMRRMGYTPVATQFVKFLDPTEGEPHVLERP